MKIKMTIKRGLLPLCALLAGCASSPPPSFKPLDYSYLPPMVLKVATVNVVNNYVPSPDQATLIGEDPAPPGATLLALLQRRLVPSGEPGTGTVTIQLASLSEANGVLSGTMTVDVNLASGDNRSTGFAEASVSASQTAPDQNASQADVQTALYQLTKQLMDNMNVQLQYQLQHSLPNWLSVSATQGAVAPGGGAPASGAIQAMPLTGPGGPAMPAQSVPGQAVPAQTMPAQAVPNYLPGAGPAALGRPQ